MIKSHLWTGFRKYSKPIEMLKVNFLHFEENCSFLDHLTKTTFIFSKPDGFHTRIYDIFVLLKFRQFQTFSSKNIEEQS